MVEVVLCQRRELRLTRWRSFRQPEIPDNQERSDDSDQPKRESRRWCRHASPGNQVGNHLWEKDNEKNDQNSAPEQGDAQGASFLALTAPNVQLNETDSEQDGCAEEEPRTQ